MGCAIGRIASEVKSSNDSIWGKGVYRGRRFCWTVNNAMRSAKISNSKPADEVPGLSLAVDNTIMIARNSNSKPAENVPGFSLVVDNAIRSGSNLEDYIVGSFDMAVNNAIRSGSNLEDYTVGSFDWAVAVNNAIRSGSDSEDYKPPDLIRNTDAKLKLMNSAAPTNLLLNVTTTPYTAATPSNTPLVTASHECRRNDKTQEKTSTTG